MALEQINGYFRLLEEHGWTYIQRNGSSPWWLAYYRTARQRIQIYLGSHGGQLIWQLPLGLRPRPACRQALFRYLLQLNHAMRLVKFTIDGDDYISLQAETAASACTFTAFKDILTAMSVYFEAYHREIELLATNQELADTWISLSPGTDEAEIMVLA